MNNENDKLSPVHLNTYILMFTPGLEKKYQVCSLSGLKSGG